MTKPSRRASNGRLACSGSSFRVDIARMIAKAPKQSGARGASAPPAIMTSASSRAMARKPSPMAIAPEAQLMPLVAFGPVQPNSIAMLQLAAPAKTVSASDGIHRARALGQEVVILLLAMGHAAKGGAHHGADAVGIFPAKVELRILQRHPGGRDAELGKAVEPAGAALLDVVGGVEVVHLARDPGLEHGRVEPGDGADGGAAPVQPVPEPLDAEADGRDRADPGDHHAALGRIHHAPDAFPVSGRPSSTNRLIPASVRDAIPWMNTGPITSSAAGRPISGQRGPVHSCTMVTSVPPSSRMHLPDHVHPGGDAADVAVVDLPRRTIHSHLRHPPGRIVERRRTVAMPPSRRSRLPAAAPACGPSDSGAALGPPLDVGGGVEGTVGWRTACGSDRRSSSRPRPGSPHPVLQVATRRYPGRRETRPGTPAAASRARSRAAV